MRKFNYPKNKDSAMYFQNVTHNITELIKTIDFLVNFPNPSTNKIRISFDDDDDFSQYIRGIYSPTFGQCFSMEVPIWIKQLKVKLSKYHKSISIQKKISRDYLLIYFFQIKAIEFVTKMDTYIYVHHKGQFWNPDSKSKVSIKTKQMNFMEIFYDIYYSIPMGLDGNKKTCGEYSKKNSSFDNCLTNVSIAFIF